MTTEREKQKWLYEQLASKYHPINLGDNKKAHHFITDKLHIVCDNHASNFIDFLTDLLTKYENEKLGN